MCDYLIIMTWPKNKDFAFTIIDDTDYATVSNIKPIYDLLLNHNIVTTKTVWVYPTRNEYSGECLLDDNYCKFILDLKSQGVEIALHSVGSGAFIREEIIEGFEIFKNKIGNYPKLHINHAKNPENIYWGNSSYNYILKFYSWLRNSKEIFYGEKPESKYFWGDIAKTHIKYIRNKIHNGINTLSLDPLMPYRDKNKKYSNFWFSSSNGEDLNLFNKLITKENIDKLRDEKGLCIVYTHFGDGFVKDGKVDNEFQEKINYLATQNAWFAPASDILDYLLIKKKNEYASNSYLLKNELDTIIKGFKRRLSFK